jgi:hypothetical protein
VNITVPFVWRLDFSLNNFQKINQKIEAKSILFESIDSAQRFHEFFKFNCALDGRLLKRRFHSTEGIKNTKKKIFERCSSLVFISRALDNL